VCVEKRVLIKYYFDSAREKKHQLGPEARCRGPKHAYILPYLYPTPVAVGRNNPSPIFAAWECRTPNHCSRPSWHDRSSKRHYEGPPASQFGVPIIIPLFISLPSLRTSPWPRFGRTSVPKQKPGSDPVPKRNRQGVPARELFPFPARNAVRCWRGCANKKSKKKINHNPPDHPKWGSRSSSAFRRGPQCHQNMGALPGVMMGRPAASGRRQRPVDLGDLTLTRPRSPEAASGSYAVKPSKLEDPGPQGALYPN